jgi:hypothetical protein
MLFRNVGWIFHWTAWRYIPPKNITFNSYILFSLVKQVLALMQVKYIPLTLRVQFEFHEFKFILLSTFKTCRSVVYII